jgi:SAM-dependent methyltransferase
MFLQFDKARREGIPSTRVWQKLDYPSESFDGILLWELMDRLDDHDVIRGAELCHRMIKPGGLLVLFVPGDHPVSRGVYSFVIEEDFQLRIRNQSHIELTSHRRQSRDIIAMLAPFTQLRSFIYRNGYKEFLFQRR